MLVVDVMTAPARTTTPGASVAHAMRVLRELRLAALPVLDARRRLVGIVSASDLLPGPDPAARATVGAVMTRRVHTAAPADDVADVARTMVLRGLRSMPVTWGGRVVGAVTRDAVLERVARPDDVLSREVARALHLQGLDGWRTAVEDGGAHAWGGPAGERGLVEAAVRGVAGVRSVQVRHETLPWDDGALRTGW